MMRMKPSIRKICKFTTTTTIVFTILLLFVLIIIGTTEGGLGKRVQRQSQSAAAVEDDDDDFAEFDDDEAELGLRARRGGQPSPDSEKKSSPDSPEKASVPKEPQQAAIEDDDDDFEDSVEEKPKKSENEEASRPKESKVDEDDEVLVEDDDFVGIDDDEFEDDISLDTGNGNTGKRRGDAGSPKLTITNVPMPARGWQAYWAELLMLSGIAVYLLNYILGRYKNQYIAQTFFETNFGILEENFHYIGDGPLPNTEDEGTRTFSKMSDSLYHIWCSGRSSCDGMLLELKLLKRQDLVAILSNIFRPVKDIFRFTIEMSKEDMDSFVFAVSTKKQALKISKEYNDLINYCPERKAGDRYGLPSQFVVMTEMGEVATAVLDSKTTSVINKYSSFIESIHFSDQFTGTKSTEPEVTKDGVMKPPDAKRLLIFTFALPLTNTAGNLDKVLDEIQPLFQFVFHTLDRFKRIRLSREGKAKADKNRAKVEEAFLKQTSAARAEAAAARKEEKRRLEKERILQEDDPEKQRRWEEKEQKREKKKKAPKMKQLKVKAM